MMASKAHLFGDDSALSAILDPTIPESKNASDVRYATSIMNPGSKSCSTIGEGGDTTIPSPWRSPKQSLLGIGLHDPLDGRQACLELNSFYQGVGQICPR